MPPKERPYLPLFHDQMQSIFKLPLLMSSCFVQCPISLCQTSTAPSIHLRNPTRLDMHLLANTPESNWMMSWSRTREVSNVPKPAFTTSVKLSTVACRCLMGWYRIEGLSNHNPIKHQATRILSQPSLHCLLIALWQVAGLCDNTFCTCLKSRCSCYSWRFSGNKGQPPRKSENHMHVFPSLAR